VETDLTARIQEAELAKKAAEDRCLELNAAWFRTEKELQQTQLQLAEALVANRELRDEVASMRLQAANVLVNYDDLTEAKLLVQLQHDVQRLQQAHQEITRSLTDCQRALGSVLEVLDAKPDSALRRVVTEKFALVFAQLAAANRLVSQAGQPAATGSITEARLLAVNDELNLAVLDLGQAQGARVGSTWRVSNSRGAVTSLRVIEVRPSLSGAMVIAGNRTDLAPGSIAKLVLETPP